MTTSAPELYSLTSFSKLFGRGTDELTIKAIEIPLIQRDYVQGRQTEVVNRIRENFIKALCDGLKPDATPVDLDFVFGDVQKDGSFSPLDGQQRLTTLFLLHCYLNWRTGNLKDQAWQKFSYATRPSARDFCEFLVSEKCNPDFSKKLSEWIKDQADYLPTWQYDPTIQSMLVVLNALHERFKNAEKSDLQEAWLKLTDVTNPAIRFHVLPIKAGGLTDELYIKMNSRGKPLTEFENFKAHFEDVLTKSHPDQASEFAQKIDAAWSDILWTYRGEDNLIDDEFIRYFRFVTEVCAWNSGIDLTRLEDLAEQVYSDPDKKTENLQFLFDAFDVWIEQNEKEWKVKDIKAEFEKILTNQSAGTSTPLFIFNSFDKEKEKEGVDLFHACCKYYREGRWNLAHTLLLYAVLLKFIHEIDESDFSKRLRIVRNLVQASNDEIREEKNRNNMPKLLADIVQIIVHGDLDKVITFNKAQIENEKSKAIMLASMPTLEVSLHTLEDHDLLRGGLTVFDFAPAQFAKRAKTFITIFGNPPYTLITGALLATGDYSWRESRWTGHSLAKFGAPKRTGVWEEIFRGKKSTHPVSIPLMALLDTVAAGTSLQGVIDAYINNPSTLKDWRYYFVKYDAMRTGTSGRYTISPSGYQVCMLDRERMSSYYRDPYLLAIWRLSGVADAIDNPWFIGYETVSRLMRLKNSGIKLQCVDNGWQLTEAPTDTGQKTAFDTVCLAHSIGGNGLCVVPQNNGIDIQDRVILGADILRDLVQNGL